jgi:glycosyltransferase involved in cell wall biosynthesis
MKIAFILPSLADYGPIIVARDLINNIYDESIQITVYYFKRTQLSIENNFKVRCQRIFFWSPIKFDEYDIIHSHMLMPDIYIWRYKHLIKRAKCVSTLHQDIGVETNHFGNKILNFFLYELWIKVLNSQDAIVTLSNTMRNQYKHKVRPNIETIYNGRDLTDSMLQQNIPPKDFELITALKKKYKIIGIIAGLNKIKGISQIIKVLPSLSEFCLIIIGNGKEKNDLIALSKKLDVTDRCFLLGYKKDAFRYMNFFDLYCMSSYSEGFGLVVLESAVYRIPVVCSNLSVFNEFYTDDEVSYFVLDNSKSLEKAIKEAYKYKSKFSENLYSKVASKFSLNTMITGYISLYQQLLLKDEINSLNDHVKL